ncbi:MAG: hypothetical protein A2W19_16450 [Spirochaetes bacterium RBG_16_49_21]|nr:MAG: hypothetical protein A2W19_16450 [Spirochaetes bacterium RBG_16_49_21]
MKLPSDIAGARAHKNHVFYTISKIAGLAAGITLLYWFVSRSNLTAIGDQLKLINVNFIFLIAATFTGYLMVTIAWRLSFYKYPGHVSLPLLFIIRQIGESLAQINPTNVIAGEALKAVLLKKQKIPYKDSIVSFTISRFLVYFSAVTLIMIGIYVFFDQLKFDVDPVSLAAVASIIFSLFVLFIYRLGRGKGVLSTPAGLLAHLARRFPHSMRLQNVAGRMREIDDELIDFYKNKKINFIAAYLLSFSSWLFGAMEFFLILNFLGFGVTFLSCVAVEVGIMIFKGVGAFIPGQIGIEEYANKMMLEFIHVPDGNIWITVSIVRRARQLFWIGIGFIAFLLVIRKTGESGDGDTVYNA